MLLKSIRKKVISMWLMVILVFTMITPITSHAIEDETVVEIMENKMEQMEEQKEELQEIKGETTEQRVYASETVEFEGGSGTKEDPYIIVNQQQLNNVRNYLDKHFKQNADIVLKVTILNEGKGWEPIGSEGSEFVGSYDGNGHIISKLYINRPEEENIGLFGVLGEGAELSNIGVEGALVVGGNYTGCIAGRATKDASTEIRNSHATGDITSGDCTGGLIGWNGKGGISGCYSTINISGGGWTGGIVGQTMGAVSECHSGGTVTATGKQAGGIAGRLESGNASISKSYSTCNVSSNNYYESYYIGGLVGISNLGTILNSTASGTVVGRGYIGGLAGYSNGMVSESGATGDVSGARNGIGGLIGYNEGKVIQSYASGNIKGTGNSSYSDSYTGGLIGENSNGGMASECYATGEVTVSGGDNKSYAGSLIGFNRDNKGISVSDCYATGKLSGEINFAGGLIGYRSNDKSIISGAYYDKNTTGRSDTDKGGIPKTTEQMKQKATFEGWDFTYTWTIDEGTDYPQLKWNSKDSIVGVSGVSLAPASLALKVGGVSQKLTATVSPAEATNKTISWKSSNPAVVSVDSNGNVQPVGTGVATVTVTTQDGGKVAECIVTVTSAETPVSSLAASPASVNLAAGSSKNISIIAKYASDSEKTISASDVTWTSNASNVATVSAGTVNALSKGNAVVIAEFGGKSVSIPVTVFEASGTKDEDFSKLYKFSELVSNTDEFNSVLERYTSTELKVIVPDKQITRIDTTHTPNILTNFRIETGKNVRKVQVESGGSVRTAERIESTVFNCDWAGLSKGAEVIIKACDSNGKQIDMCVIRLKEGNNTINNDMGTISAGNYSLLDLISDNQLFNSILNIFSLAELNVGIPVRYITQIDVAHTFYTTSFTITTAGSVERVTIRTLDGNELEAQSQGSGIYKRDVSGLTAGDTVIVCAYDKNGQLLYEKPAFVD